MVIREVGCPRLAYVLVRPRVIEQTTGDRGQRVELGFIRLVNERSVACTTVRRQSAEHSLPVNSSRVLHTGNTLRPN